MHLFTDAPALRPLFPADMTALQGHFEAALALVIRNLEDMAVLEDSLRDLGAQHVGWVRSLRTTSLCAMPSFVPFGTLLRRGTGARGRLA